MKKLLMDITRVATLKPTYSFWIMSRIRKYLDDLICPDFEKTTSLKIKDTYFTANGSEAIVELDEREYYITVTAKKKED